MLASSGTSGSIAASCSGAAGLVLNEIVMVFFLALRFGCSEGLTVRTGGSLDTSLGLEATGTVGRGWYVA